MKTFSEACSAVLVRKAKPNDTSIPQDMVESMAKFVDIQKEVQHSEEAHMLSGFLLDVIQDEMDLDDVELLCVAFSHGVMVGMMMEKSE